jgi:hypothetical protein
MQASFEEIGIADIAAMSNIEDDVAYNVGSSKRSQSGKAWKSKSVKKQKLSATVQVLRNVFAD